MIHRVLRIAAIAAAFAFVLAILTQPVRAQDTPNEPGKFDFYVLALSWSPSYCEAARERASGRVPPQQCGDRPYSFVVHGLWPQNERSYPSFCQKPSPRIERSLADSMLDLMPSPGLVFHQWNRHGTCSGMAAADYFGTVRKAREKIQVPDEFKALASAKSVSPNEVVDAFLKANPGLKRDSIAVSCDSRRLNEVRVCMSKDLTFRDCAEISRRSCRRDNVVMPPVRGMKAAELR